MWKFGATFGNGKLIAPTQYLYEKEATGMESPKCNPCFSAKSPPRSTDLQNTRFHASPYKAARTNLRKFGTTFGHGTVIAPTKYIYQKQETGMENPKV